MQDVHLLRLQAVVSLKAVQEMNVPTGNVNAL